LHIHQIRKLQNQFAVNWKIDKTHFKIAAKFQSQLISSVMYANIDIFTLASQNQMKVNSKIVHFCSF